MMGDRYPTVFELAIQRDALRSYLCAKWLRFGLFYSVLLGIGLSLTLATKGLEGFHDYMTRLGRIGSIALPLSVAIPYAFHFGCGRWISARIAHGIRVRIEGPFLRIVRSGFVHQDTKVHFRAVAEWSLIEDSTMREFGVPVLRVTTFASGARWSIDIPGLRDCRNTRDSLAEIALTRRLG